MEETTQRKNYNNKQCFVGVSLSSNASTESGIAVIDRNLNLIRIDKVYNISDLQIYLTNLAPFDSMAICVDLPRNANLISGKWRLEAKPTQIFKINNRYNSKHDWIDRFSDRGSDLCESLIKSGLEIYRYNCYYTKNLLKLVPPYKSRTPAACKYLQLIIQNNLKIRNIPNNLIALSGLDAIIGAYNVWKINTCQRNAGCKYIGEFNNIPVITAFE